MTSEPHVGTTLRSRRIDGFTGEDYDRGWHDATKRIARELAAYFAKNNPFFDRRKFMKACDLEDKQ